MMNEQIVQMGLMWVLAGLSAGWLAETCISRRGYGLVVDMGLGVGAGLAGGGVFLAISGLPAGMLVMFVFALFLAAGVILAQRLCWPCEAGERERKARLRLSELGGPSRGEKRTSGPGLLGGGNGRTGTPAVTRTLMRIATTGIYLLRGVTPRASASGAGARRERRDHATPGTPEGPGRVCGGNLDTPDRRHTARRAHGGRPGDQAVTHRRGARDLLDGGASGVRLCGGPGSSGQSLLERLGGDGRRRLLALHALVHQNPGEHPPLRGSTWRSEPTPALGIEPHQVPAVALRDDFDLPETVH